MKLHVRDGEYVKKDTVLAELSNPEKLKEQSQLNQEQIVSFKKALWYQQSPELEHGLGRCVDSEQEGQRKRREF